MSGTTTILGLIKNVDSDNARTIITTDESANMDKLEAVLTGADAVKIPTAALAANAATVPVPWTLGGTSTGSTNWAELAGPSIAASAGSTISVSITVELQNSGAAANVLGLTLDGGADLEIARWDSIAGGAINTVTVLRDFLNVSAAVHTVHLRWKTSAGTMTAWYLTASLWEIKR